MNTQLEILEDTIAYLLGIIDSIDRTKAIMIDDYPNWDNTDNDQFKTLTIDRLNIAISKLGLL
jgi:hypothetical protein